MGRRRVRLEPRCETGGEIASVRQHRLLTARVHMISNTWATGGRDATDAPNMALGFLWAIFEEVKGRSLFVVTRRSRRAP